MNAAARVNRPRVTSVPVTSSMTAPAPNRLISGCGPGAAPGGKPNSLTRPWDRKQYARDDAEGGEQIRLKPGQIGRSLS